MLRAGLYNDALSSFKLALASNSNDHQAAFGAGLACEATGQGGEALRYYQQACAAEDDPRYTEARDRAKAFGHRIRKGA